jgi:hypothetical protein
MVTKKASAASASKKAGFGETSTGASVKAAAKEVANLGGSPIGQVTLTYGQVLGGWFRAFVATDSRSPYILATLAETRGVPFATMYCGARNYRGQNGVLITLFVSGPIPPDVIVIVTLMQEGAARYAAPILYIGG